MKALLFVLLLVSPPVFGQVFPTTVEEIAPPIRNFHDYQGAMKGAVPGFAKKPVYFDSRLAESHLRHLYNNLGVRLIISLDHCKNMTRVIDKINEDYPGVDLKHMCRRVLRSKKYYKKNIALFKEIAALIGNESFYIHCRYGAHRAPTALTGAWIEKGKLSYEEAFERAGGNIRHFRSKFHHELLNQVRRYARDVKKKEAISNEGFIKK